MALVPLVNALDGAVDAPTPFAGRTFDPDRQWRFTMELLPLLGFDLQAGRQDRTSIPSPGARTPPTYGSTTRIDPTNPSPAVFRFTSAGMGYTSRASLRSTTGRPWPRLLRWASTSRSRASGRT